MVALIEILAAEDLAAEEAEPLTSFWPANFTTFSKEKKARLLKGLQNAILIDLDADNVYDFGFVEHTAGTMSKNRSQLFRNAAGSSHPSSSTSANEPDWLELYPPALPSRPHDSADATTGRVAIWATDYLSLGGYDEEDNILPSGHQDVDMLKRTLAAASQYHCKNFKEQLPVVAGGIAFPTA